MKPFTSDWWVEQAREATAWALIDLTLERQSRYERKAEVVKFCIKRALKAARREGYHFGRVQGYEEGYNDGMLGL